MIMKDLRCLCLHVVSKKGIFGILLKLLGNKMLTELVTLPTLIQSQNYYHIIPKWPLEIFLSVHAKWGRS